MKKTTKYGNPRVFFLITAYEKNEGESRRKGFFQFN